MYECVYMCKYVGVSVYISISSFYADNTLLKHVFDTCMFLLFNGVKCSNYLC